ncbi:MAG: zf-HC2 domain-containing protein [Firmicutes bacterium]|nr:zf-HC2 domain-containing protein [Bacillota bacterium]
MNCGDWQEWIQRDLDGELSDEEGKKLRYHLSLCPGCAEFAADMRSLNRELSALPPVEPACSLTDRILQQTGPREPRKQTAGKKQSLSVRQWRRFWPLTGAAAAVLLAAAWLISNESGLPTQKGGNSAQTSTTLHSSESSTKGQAWSQEVPSPEGRFIAQITPERRVLVRNREGEVQYRSPNWEEERPIRVEWMDEETFVIQFAEGGKEKIVHLEETDGKK